MYNGDKTPVQKLDSFYCFRKLELTKFLWGFAPRTF